MDHAESWKRILLIINKLKSSKFPVKKNELLDYVNSSLDRNGKSCISKRTIERDLGVIGEVFHMYFTYDRKTGGYVSTDTNLTSLTDRYNELLLNFDLINELDNCPNLRTYVLAEHHRPAGCVYMTDLVKAIKFSHPITFDYTLYRKDNFVITKHVLPHYLKESNNRWYLLAFEEGILKTFGIERINNLFISNDETFERQMNIDVNELFKDCYGIWNQENIPVEYIELCYDAIDGRFLKSVPLHHSQKILIDNENEFRISLRLKITNDFVMELLSRSRSLTIIKPQHLREHVLNVYREALRRNGL